MKEKYIPGGGCQCHAHSESECGCDVDWTPREVYELREQRDRLAEALRELCETLLNDKPRDITESLYKAGDALAAVKGGSDDH
jgi:hypothetical protein